MPESTDSLTVEAVARWEFKPGATASVDRAGRNLQIFRWLEAIQAESVSGAGEVDAEIAAELRRLDAKLSMVLDLLLDRAELGAKTSAISEYSLSISGVAVRFDAAAGEALLSVGEVGLLEWNPEARWPSKLSFVARVVAKEAGMVHFEFQDISEAETDCLERWIFREHRRARERYR